MRKVARNSKKAKTSAFPKRVSATKAGKTARKNNSVNQEKLNQSIQERAYFIWEEKGRLQGSDRDNWLQAEKEIRIKIK